MLLKNEIKQKLETRLIPQQVEFARLLQISEKDIQAQIDSEIEKNPAIVVDENVDKKIIDKFYFSGKSFSKDEKKYVFQESLYDKLCGQLFVLNLSSLEEKIAKYVIGNLDEFGFFTMDYNVVANRIFIETKEKIDVVTIKKVIEKIQTLKPLGIATRNIHDFILLQIDKLLKESDITKNILKDNLDFFLNGDLKKIKQKTKFEEQYILKILKVIKNFKKYPFYGFVIDEREIKTYAADFCVFKDLNDKLIVKLKFYGNTYLAIDDLYKQTLLKNKKDNDFSLFTKEKIEKARSFINLIDRRRDFLLKTMVAIVEFQHDFFINGDMDLLKPMTLRNIAPQIDADISVVSRVVNNKAVETCFGVFLLKDLFSCSIFTKDGEKVGKKIVLKKVKELLKNEDKKKPLSDEKIVERLKEDGFMVARRTVTKYRKQLNIPCCCKRKLFYKIV